MFKLEAKSVFSMIEAAKTAGPYSGRVGKPITNNSIGSLDSYNYVGWINLKTHVWVYVTPDTVENMESREWSAPWQQLGITDVHEAQKLISAEESRIKLFGPKVDLDFGGNILGPTGN